MVLKICSLVSIFVFLSVSPAFAGKSVSETLQAATGHSDFLSLVLRESTYDLKEFLVEGADIDFHGVDSKGANPLHYAAFLPNVDWVKKLIALKVNPNQQDAFGITPLMLASLPQPGKEAAALEVIEELIRGGANINEMDRRGESALIKSVVGGKAEVADFLLLNNADVKRQYWHDCLGKCFSIKALARIFIGPECLAPEAAPIAGSCLAPDPRGQLSRVVEENNFNVGRELGEYMARLGPRFKAFLDGLTESDHILDAGSGETIAWSQYLMRNFHSYWNFIPHLNLSAPRARASAVTFQISDGAEEKARQAGVHVLKGRFFEDLADHEVLSNGGSLAGIVDFYGVLAYTSKPSQILQQYFQLLRPSGKIFFLLGMSSPTRYFNLSRPTWGQPMAAESLYASTVVTSGKEEISFPEWIRRIPGIRVTSSIVPSYTPHTKLEIKYLSYESLEIEVVDPAIVRIPILELTQVRIESKHPFPKKFRELDLKLQIE
jgi:hypothetical protein